MASIINIEVDEADVQKVQLELFNIQKKVPMALRTAINNTATYADKQDTRVTKKAYTARDRLNDFEKRKATTANLEAILKDKGSNISMTHRNWLFDYSYSNTGGTSSGVYATIKNANGSKLIGKHGNKAWYSNGALQHGGSAIMVRTGAARYPIEKVASISSPVERGNDSTWGTVEDDVRAKLHENTQIQIRRILGL